MKVSGREAIPAFGPRSFEEWYVANTMVVAASYRDACLGFLGWGAWCSRWLQSCFVIVECAFGILDPGLQ